MAIRYGPEIIFSYLYRVTLTFDPKPDRDHCWLMGSLFTKSHEERWKSKADVVRKSFLVIHVLWPLDPKINTFCVLSFMKISEKGKQLRSGNQFQLSISCDLDLWTPKSIGVILVIVAMSRCRDVAMSRCRVVALSRCRDVALSTTRHREMAQISHHSKSTELVSQLARIALLQQSISDMWRCTFCNISILLVLRYMYLYKKQHIGDMLWCTSYNRIGSSKFNRIVCMYPVDIR